MEKRPEFTSIKSFAEFSKHYWYREELQKICKSLGIDASGMKADLNRNIEEFFKGNKILPKAHVGTGKVSHTTTSRFRLKQESLNAASLSAKGSGNFSHSRLESKSSNLMRTWLQASKKQRKMATSLLRLAICWTFFMAEKPMQNTTRFRFSGTSLSMISVPMRQLPVFRTN